MVDQCCFPKCRNISEFRYIGKDVCAKHWEELCEADGKTEKKLLKKIELVRNHLGSVINTINSEKK